MSTIPRTPTNLAASGALGGLLAVCLLYGGYALASGFGLIGQEVHRALPPAFLVHATSGGIALVAAGLQPWPTLRRHFPALHRVIGRVYVAAVALASLSGVANAIAFDAPAAAKASLCLLCVIWLATSVAGQLAARRGDLARHRTWMLRSLALSMFFVTFSVWVPIFARTGMPHDIGYTLAVTLSWTLNLAIAEAIIRATPTAAHRRETVAG